MEGVVFWVELNGGGGVLGGADMEGVVFWVELNGGGGVLGGATWRGCGSVWSYMEESGSGQT